MTKNPCHPKETITSTPQVYLRWASRNDIPEISRILHTNFLNFELFDHVAPDRKERSDELYQFVLKRVRYFIAQPKVRFMVAERLDLGISPQHQTAKIMGFATWEAQGHGNALAEEWQRQDGGWLNALERQLVSVERLYNRYCEGGVVDCAAFGQIIATLQASYAGLERLQSNVHLQFLFVDPVWQKGYGVGQKLLQWGLDMADQFGFTVVLESSLAGHGFYLKHGFTCYTKVLVDLKPEHAYETPILFYEPGSRCLKPTKD